MLRRQIEQEMAKFAPQAADIVERNQRDRVARGRADSRELTRQMEGRRGPRVDTTWNALPDSAVVDLVGFAQDGSPLKALFDALGPQVSQAIQSELATGLALGRNPVVVARAVAAKSGMGLARALTISRTESLRAYRETTRRSYDASEAVTGWVWLSARQTSTCAACWAMDGTKHPNSESMAAHPNCRCAMLPDTGSQPDFGNGPALFGKLSEAEQRTILGPSKHDAFKSGQIKLEDLVVERRSADWGNSVQVASLEKAKAAGSSSPAAEKIWPVEESRDLAEIRRFADNYKRSDLTKDEEEALLRYMGKDYQAIQGWLRAKDPTPAVVENLASAIDSALKKNVLGQERPLYRGVGHGAFGNTKITKAGEVDKLVGKTFKDSAFQSTSLDPAISSTFADTVTVFDASGAGHYTKHVLEIKGRADTRGLFMPSVEDAADTFVQAEFLLPRNTELRIIGIRRRKASFSGALRYEEVTIEAEIV